MSITSEKLLASLCYFSAFFAPILFPIIVWIVAMPSVSTHAKKALIYHILPYFLLVATLICFVSTDFIKPDGLTILPILLGVIFILAILWCFIYNLYCGIKVLLLEQI
ncbi:DUF4870 domain-containing protein [Staphylococcus lutrae]|uniref:DUF4870 domain-containing protein n=1 Tax=Staphylococcus lutrae TaxID=155085 RepID=A0AAC9WJ04_9STAP|nr:DUF4870 domain-containing protein [Staphylococcus lutrae]ARJ50834.1 hypothetical protein B5P37_05625 [Staphylococcus lutrae]PNZ36810.1 hypothetical protein CD134_07355 [Staphylococcus lutrae]